MTRLAGITTAYAVVVALVLVSPLSAAPEDDQAAVEPAPAPATEPAPPPEAETETVPAEPPPAPAEPAPAPAPAQAPAPAPPPAPEPAAPAEPVPAVADAPKPRSRKDRAEAKAAASQTVTVRDFEFAPKGITVNVGDTVTWSNDGPTQHTATANDGSFDTGLLAEGQSGSHTFDQAGTFSYFCQPHPFMKGTITVQAAATGGEASGGSGGEAGAGSTGGSESAAPSNESSGPTLPTTGLDSGGLAVLGLATLALGAWLRRRAGAAH